MKDSNKQNRRQALKDILSKSLAGVGAIGVMGSSTAWAQLCGGKTPKQPEGPFYPVKNQQDKDEDLTYVNGNSTSAEGQIIIVSGIVTDQNCKPVAGALVEIWQACKSGKYNHPQDPNTAPLDPNFQYWGKSITKDDGSYQFKTIIPGAYPADRDWIRPPHIHYKVSKLGYIELITQMYFKGEAYNKTDKILQRLNRADQAKVVVELVQGDKFPVALFDLILEKV
jgi:protocatechuate 3,4-dioxygenase, beta subunit